MSTSIRCISFDPTGGPSQGPIPSMTLPVGAEPIAVFDGTYSGFPSLMYEFDTTETETEERQLHAFPVETREEWPLPAGDFVGFVKGVDGNRYACWLD